MTALELADRLASGWPALEDVNAAVIELRRLAELERDAARYRWLREQHWSKSDLCVVENPKRSVKLGFYCPSEDRLDDALDAAMGEAK